MNTGVLSAASMVVVKRGTIENLKEEALKLAQLYGSNIEIQIDVGRRSDIASVRITEYNV